jgi:diguanylate cyclase (GGDEF)-like protein
MTFRARLTLFFVGIVAAPLLVGALTAAHASDTQAIHDADSRLQVAAATATGQFQREQLLVARALAPDVALQAFRAGTADELDRIREFVRLDYLLVMHHSSVVASSVDPRLARTPTAIAGGALRPVTAQHRVFIRRAGGGSVIGGRIWQPDLPGELRVTAAVVLDGHPLGTTQLPFVRSTTPTSDGSGRAVCVCRGGVADTSGIFLSTSTSSQGLARWFHWPAVGLLVLGIGVLAGLAYLLAGLVARPLSRLAAEATAVARGEPDTEPQIDPGEGREIYEVATQLRTVSAELSGSRGELVRTQGRLAATERLTLIDPLTGGWNRRYMERAIREQVKRYVRFGSHFSLLVIDIDRFKRVNDEFGHAVGDQVLIQVAQTIDGSIRRDIDVLARFGGEEFVVVLPETDPSGAFAAAEKIRELVAESKFEDSKGRPVSVTVSIGVAACPDDGSEGAEVLARADSAMYRSKAAGRNQTKTASRADFRGPGGPGGR